MRDLLKSAAVNVGAGLLGVIGLGTALGTIMAMAVPTTAGFRHEASAQATTPEDYPELVGVSYEGRSGAYFAPRAYSGIAPIIRDNVYDIPDQTESAANHDHDVGGDQAPAHWDEDKLSAASDLTYEGENVDGFDRGAL